MIRQYLKHTCPPWHVDVYGTLLSIAAAVRYCCRFACGIRPAKKTNLLFHSRLPRTLQATRRLTLGCVVRSSVRRGYGRRRGRGGGEQVVAREEEGRSLGREGRHAAISSFHIFWYVSGASTERRLVNGPRVSAHSPQQLAVVLHQQRVRVEVGVL